MEYTPPKNIYEVNAKLDYKESLHSKDPRYVPTDTVRGDFSFNELKKLLDINPTTNQLTSSSPEKRYIFFCGHIGCGKSTELRRMAYKFNSKSLFTVIFTDAEAELDIHNIQYTDVLMTIAHKLFETLDNLSIEIDKINLEKIDNWFVERIENQQETRDFALELKAGIKAEPKIPFLAKIFAALTTSIKTNSTYKEEFRRIIKNSFAELALHFNTLINVSKDALINKGYSGNILFIIDGLDKTSKQDSKRFFIDDVNQMQLINSNFIYCAPIAMLSRSTQVQQKFDYFILPMIKLTEKGSKTPLEDSYQTLRELIYKRADKSLFDSEETVNYIIKYSGGSPREALKILSNAFQKTTTDIFDKKAVEKAVAKLASEFKRYLYTDDYEILYQYDQNNDLELNNDRVQDLIINLALLEYNQFWRQPHPVIRLIKGYENLKKK